MAGETKRLRKSSSGKILAGVCSGVAEYFGIDPLIVRIGWVLAALAGGLGVLLYIVAAFVMPSALPGETISAAPAATSPFLLVAGIVLSAAGGVLLLFTTGLFPPWFFRSVPWEALFPLALIGIGLALLLKRGAPQAAAETGEGDIPEPRSGTSETPRRLYRSRFDRKLFGVCGGLGEYLRIDPVLIRLLFVAGAFFSFGITIAAYLILLLFAPREPLRLALS